jgi:hypothetical protein
MRLLSTSQRRTMQFWSIECVSFYAPPLWTGEVTHISGQRLILQKHLI